MDRLALGFTDTDQNRARFHADTTSRVNRLIGQTVTVKLPDSANQEFAVRHEELGRKVTEVEILMKDDAGSLYRSSPEKWTTRVSFFKYSGSGGSLLLRVR